MLREAACASHIRTAAWRTTDNIVGILRWMGCAGALIHDAENTTVDSKRTSSHITFSG